MTDNEIIKTLPEAIKYALDLIKRQQKEIEYWKSEANSYQNMWGEAVSNLQAVRNETIKVFAERLIRKSELMSMSVYAVPERAVFVSDIENVAKEMPLVC